MEKLVEILKKYNPDVDYYTNEHIIDEEALDSFDIISLVADIDREFDVEITAKDIIPENFNSAKKIYELIERLS